jgi:hypothetical protein
MCLDDNNTVVPPPSAEESELRGMALDIGRQERDLQKRMFPYVMDAAGYRFNPQTGYMERKPYESPTSAALETSLARQEAQKREALSRRLGSDYETTSTPGIQAMAALSESQEMLRDESRRQGMGLASDIQSRNFAQLQGLSDPGIGLMGALTGAQQPYNIDRQYAMQGSLANQQQQNSLWNALGMAGGMIGYGLLT